MSESKKDKAEKIAEQVGNEVMGEVTNLTGTDKEANKKANVNNVMGENTGMQKNVKECTQNIIGDNKGHVDDDSDNNQQSPKNIMSE